MPIPQNRPAHELPVTARLADLSTESACYAVAPIRGRIVRAYSVIENAITGGDAAWTIKINGTDAAAAVTVTQDGSAGGDVDEAVMNAVSPVNYCSEGDAISFHSDGASSTACPTNFVAVIRPGG